MTRDLRQASLTHTTQQIITVDCYPEFALSSLFGPLTVNRKNSHYHTHLRDKANAIEAGEKRKS